MTEKKEYKGLKKVLLVLAIIIVAALVCYLFFVLGGALPSVGEATLACYPRPVDKIGLLGSIKCAEWGPVSLVDGVKVDNEVDVSNSSDAELALEDVEDVTVPPLVPSNTLVNPELHHADSHAPEEGVGSFDVGVKDDQIGIAFGWHILWPKGNVDAGGDSCDLVILTPGWYENLQILDGRYEIYTVPTSDYAGWVKVLATQRSEEQAANYGCQVWNYDEIPVWESSIPSPPSPP